MIQTYSSTIRRKEMEAVLTCMVNEQLGAGEMGQKLVQTVKELTGCDGAVTVRSPAIALDYVLRALDIPKDGKVMLSALAPAWQIQTVEALGYSALVLDVREEDGLVPPELVEQGIKDGGRIFVLHEGMGVLPDIQAYLSLNIPIVEDISQSAFAFYPEEVKEGDAAAKPKEKKPAEGESQNPEDADDEPKGKRAGMYGVYAIFGMEDRDVVTAGGGAVVMAPGRREWSVLKRIAEEAPSTDLMPDMNAALAYVETKEFKRNEKMRRELYTLYTRAIMSGKHKTFVRAQDYGSTIYSFPLVLNTGFKDVKAYAQKKGIEVRQAYENSIIALRQESLASQCMCANSLLLRCALFPLYPRLGQKDASRIVKVLSTLP